MRLSTLPRLRRLRSGVLAVVRLRCSPYARWGRDGRLLALVATAPPTEAPPAADPDEDLPDAPADPTDQAPVQRLPEPPKPADRTPVDQQLAPPENGVPFFIPIGFLEGWETSDHRYFTPGGFGRRDLPMTLMAMVENPDGGWGHDDAIVAGRLDTLERFDASAELNRETGQPFGDGVFAWRGTGYLTPNPDQPGSQAVVDYIGSGTLRGVSADVSEAVSEVEVVAIDDDGFPSEIRENVLEGAIVQLTVCPAAAFPGATIELGTAPWAGGSEAPAPAEGTPPAATPPAEGEQPTPATPPAEGEQPPAQTASARPPVRLARAGEPGAVRITGDDCAPCAAGRPALTASGGPEAPPRAWFERPEPEELTPWTVLASGEAFGHLAGWETCHTGVANACVNPPRDDGNGYGLFHTGAVLSAEGDMVPVGHITLGGGHANINLGVAPAMEHYDNAGAAVADVRAVDGRHGIWLSGAVRPEASEQQVRQLRAHALSGDWRADARGGPLRLVAALCVNVPGFPVPRAMRASGAPRALVAAGGSQLDRQRARAANGGVDPRSVEEAVSRLMQPLLASAARQGLARLTRRGPRR